MYKVISHHKRVLDVFVVRGGQEISVKLAPKSTTETEVITNQLTNLKNLKLVAIREIATGSVQESQKSASETKSTAATSDSPETKKGGKK